MADPIDLNSLAKRFLDLWQENVSAAAVDPATVDAAQRFAELNAGAPAAWFALWTRALQTAEHGGPHGATRSTNSASSGAPAAGAAPVDRRDDVAELARRIAILEERIARLEQPPRRRARSRRPAGAGGA